MTGEMNAWPVEQDMVETEQETIMHARVVLILCLSTGLPYLLMLFDVQPVYDDHGEGAPSVREITSPQRLT